MGGRQTAQDAGGGDDSVCKERVACNRPRPANLPGLPN